MEIIVLFYGPGVSFFPDTFSLNDFSKEREIGTLLSFAKVDNNITNFCIVTWQQEETIHQDNVTINVIPLYKFLLAEQR